MAFDDLSQSSATQDYLLKQLKGTGTWTEDQAKEPRIGGPKRGRERLRRDEDGLCMIIAIADISGVHCSEATLAIARTMVRDGGLSWSECVRIIMQAPEFIGVVREDSDSLHLPYDGATIVLRITAHNLYHAMISENGEEKGSCEPPKSEIGTRLDGRVTARTQRQHPGRNGQRGGHDWHWGRKANQVQPNDKIRSDHG